LCFFFSSRRRHTRSDRDWSSDVCSSDLFLNGHAKFVERAVVAGVLGRDALANRLGALELRASIEEAALLAAMQFELALGTFAVEIGRASCRERVYVAMWEGF